MFTLTIQLDSVASLERMSKLISGITATPTAEVVENFKKATKAVAKKEEAPAPVKEVPAPVAKVNVSAPTGVTYDDVKNVTLKASDAGPDMEAKFVALLATFGAKRAPELKPEQYAEYVDKANQLLSAEDAATSLV